LFSIESMTKSNGQKRILMSSNFEKAGTIYLSGSRKSLKIEINDPDTVFKEVYYVSIRDIQTVLAQPKKIATIVKVKDEVKD